MRNEGTARGARNKRLMRAVREANTKRRSDGLRVRPKAVVWPLLFLAPATPTESF